MWLGKIPGHSGTQFKTRRAFEKANDFQKSNLTNITLANPTAHAATFGNLRSRWPDYLAGIIFSLIFIFFILQIGVSLKLNKQEISHQEALIIDDEANHHMYSLTLLKAQRLLESSMIIESQRYFIAANERCPNEIETIIGFMKTSAILCKELGQQCQLAEDYAKYLMEKGHLGVVQEGEILPIIGA